MRGLQAGITAEETAAAAVTGIMTAEEATIAIMTGKERENLVDLVVMIQGATAGHVHVPQGEVLGIMIDMGVTNVEIGTRCKKPCRSLGFTLPSVFLLGNSREGLGDYPVTGRHQLFICIAL